MPPLTQFCKFAINSFCVNPPSLQFVLSQSCNVIIRCQRQKLNKVNNTNSRMGRIVLLHFDLTKVVVFKEPHDERYQHSAVLTIVLVQMPHILRI